MISFLFYAALSAALFIAGLYVLDWFIKSGGRKGDEDISLNAVFIAGAVLTGTAAFAVIGIFTGKLAPVKLAFFVIPAGLVATYLWRAKTASDNERTALELLSEEEARVREVARTDPRNAAAWTRLAEIAEKKGEPRRAADYLQKGLELEPSEEAGLKAKALRESPKGS
jgi:tetratricopeptide (TPR) repeat protein